MSLVYAYCYTNKSEDIAIDCDNENICLEVIESMIHKGYKRIGLISGPVDSVLVYKRLIGYQKALMQARLPMDPNLIVYGNWSEKSGYTASKELIELPDPVTAIVCMNDWMALGAMGALKEKQIQIPQQVEVVGFDNIDLCEYTEPTRTSIENLFWKLEEKLQKQ